MSTPKPTVYIHRVGEWYDLYMDEANLALLRTFADVIDDGPQLTVPDNKTLIAQLKKADAILSLNGLGAVDITASVLDECPGIKAVSVAHWWISFHGQVLPGWKEHGLRILDASYPSVQAVAEWTLGCMLMGVRKLHLFNDKLKQGDVWAEPRRNVSLLCECTVGLLGLGRIGRQVAKHLRSFDASIKAYDPFIDPAMARAENIELVDIKEIFSTCDVISVHLPVTEGTKESIGKAELDLIKKDAVLINSARNAVFNNRDLIEALQQKRFYAFLDVFDEEPLPLDHVYRKLDTVFITPHIAGDTNGMFKASGRTGILALKDYFSSNL
jgi:D-3-phosphoglycerate dehydrogenase